MVQLLTKTSAMGCDSWSLPAGPIGAGGSCAAYDPGGTCRQCYALQGQYRFRNVQTAQVERLRLWRERGPDLLRPELSRRAGHFRVFDSGDFETPEDPVKWWQLARENPQIKFWVVSRCWRMTRPGGPAWEGWRDALAQLASLPNVCLRFSFDEHDRELAEGLIARIPGATRAVVADDPSYACPKQAFPDGTPRHNEDASCTAAGCRACWDKDHIETRFMLHGQKKPVNILDMARKRGVK